MCLAHCQSTAVIRLSFQTRATQMIKNRNRTTPKEGMEDTRPGAAAEQVGQPEEDGMEKPEPGKAGEDETDGHQPMVEPFAGRVPLNRVLFRLIAFPPLPL